MTCCYCGSGDHYRARRKAWERALILIRTWPIRCARCGTRQYRVPGSRPILPPSVALASWFAHRSALRLERPLPSRPFIPGKPLNDMLFALEVAQFQADMMSTRIRRRVRGKMRNFLDRIGQVLLVMLAPFLRTLLACATPYRRTVRMVQQHIESTAKTALSTTVTAAEEVVAAAGRIPWSKPQKVRRPRVQESTPLPIPRKSFWRLTPSYSSLSDLGSRPMTCTDCGACDWRGARLNLVHCILQRLGIHSFRCARCMRLQTTLPSFSVRLKLRGIPAQAVAPVTGRVLQASSVRNSIRVLNDAYSQIATMDTPPHALETVELSTIDTVHSVTAA